MTRAANHYADTVIPAINAPTNVTFQIKNAKLYLPVVTLLTQDDNKFLEQLKSVFKRTIKRNKYRPQMAKQTKTNKLNYLIDPTFNKVNRLFVLSFEYEDDRTSFSKYDTTKVDIKNFNVLIYGKKFSDVPVKTERRNIRKIIETNKNNDYATGKLLDYEYFSMHYKLIATDLGKKNELDYSDLNQQINFIGKLEENEATMLFIIEKLEETFFEFLQNSVSII